LLDFGIGAALTREMARLSIGKEGVRARRNILRTLEVLYCLIFFIVGTAIIVLSSYIAANWVNPVTLSLQSVTDSLRLIGISIALQSVMGFYQGGLAGLQRQVFVSFTLVAVTTARGIGALLILAFVTRRIEAFFLWQIVPLAMGAMGSRCYIWHVLPHDQAPQFDRKAIRSCWKFAFGWGANSIALALFSQADKLILSRFLTLDNLGYYSLAQTVAGPVAAVTNSVGTSVFPRFTQLASRGSLMELRNIYHKANQCLILLVAPFAVVVSVFSFDILSIVTGSQAVAHNASMPLKLIVLGAMFSALITLPNYLQLAYGYFRLILGSLLALSATYLPLLIYMVKSYKTDGAALSWLIINFCFLFSVPLMHRNFLRGELREWLVRDTMAPLFSAGVCGAVIGYVYPFTGAYPAGLIPIALSYCLILFVTAGSLNEVRSGIRSLRPVFSNEQRYV
jgi:O-antigen/teichoic acid export membrane protein